MAVFSEVSFDEASDFLKALGLGQLQDIRGCTGGIENTNYFVDTDQGEYVLTLFERLRFEQLPFYLQFMKHLAGSGIAVPDPQTAPGASAGQPDKTPQSDSRCPSAIAQPARIDRCTARRNIAPAQRQAGGCGQ